MPEPVQESRRPSGSTSGPLRRIRPDNAFVALNTAFLTMAWSCCRSPRGAVVEEPIEITIRRRRERTRCRPSAHADPGGRGRAVHHRRNLHRARAATSPTPSPRSWPATARSSITTRCRRESREAFHVATLQVQLGRSANFTLALHLARRRAGPQRRQRGALRRHRMHAQRPLPRQRHAARRQSHRHRPRQAARHQPRAVQGHSGRHAPTRSSTAGSSSAKTRRRPTPSRPTRTWCFPTTPSSTPSRSCRFYADDVRCTHGATIGQLDAEVACSTCNRAASASSEARSLLTYAFAHDIVDRIKVQSAEGSAGTDPVREIP